MARGFEIAVVGGGMIGAALAYGLARSGVKAVLLDEGDTAFRAARGNFGLVWVQGKGVDAPAYANWTQESAELWPGYAAELESETGVALGYARPGGIELCLSEAELTARGNAMARLEAQSAGRFRYEMLDRRALTGHLPKLGGTGLGEAGLGEAVVGACYSPHDGHVNPLALLRALHAGFIARGGAHRPGWRVETLSHERSGFTLSNGTGRLSAERVVLAAGLGNAALAPQLGIEARIVPLRGQILVTERLAPFLPLPTLHARQSAEGACLLGDSQEDVGLDESTTGPVMGEIARRAVACFPFLETVRMTRAWGALRIMTPDGVPIYQESGTCPGAYLATGHSGVTLAAAHSLVLAKGIAEGALPDAAAAFSAERFESV
jgi:glycine/D-amino acid oxidase-like deaminating enzyme